MQNFEHIPVLVCTRGWAVVGILACHFHVGRLNFVLRQGLLLPRFTSQRSVASWDLWHDL